MWTFEPTKYRTQKNIETERLDANSYGYIDVDSGELIVNATRQWDPKFQDKNKQNRDISKF